MLKHSKRESGPEIRVEFFSLFRQFFVCWLWVPRLHVAFAENQIEDEQSKVGSFASIRLGIEIHFRLGGMHEKQFHFIFLVSRATTPPGTFIRRLFSCFDWRRETCLVCSCIWGSYMLWHKEAGRAEIKVVEIPKHQKAFSSHLAEQKGNGNESRAKRFLCFSFRLSLRWQKALDKRKCSCASLIINHWLRKKFSVKFMHGNLRNETRPALLKNSSNSPN